MYVQFCWFPQELVNKLEKAHGDHVTYRQSLQDAEKWVMAMSFKLMTFNVLEVSSPESTQEQVDKQQVLE